MGFSNGLGSTINYFNNLINNQIAQGRFNNFVQQGQSQNSSATQTQQVSELSKALDSLTGLLNANSSSGTTANQQQLAYTVQQLVNSGASLNKISNLINSITGDTGDLLYTRTGSDDPNLTLQNKIQAFGQDLPALLSQTTQLAQFGEDVDKYLDTAANVVGKGDYDDLRRFISVTDSVMYTGQNLDKFYDFTNEILDKRHYDMESNIFSVQTMLGYGTNLDTALDIMHNMETTNLAGRNNLVDLNRVIIDARNKGCYLPYMFDQMAKSGDTRAFMDDYMAHNGMKTTAPDFEKFKRIERIDGEDMVIHQGESAALFAQAVSSVDGLLPESVLYWSSMQTGAISHGSSYLDLSKLGPGTYDIYVKIGNYAGGTDTAKKRVIILPNEDTKGNNGLGDQKDSDNTVKFDDASNPGHNKVTDTGKDHESKTNERSEDCDEKPVYCPPNHESDEHNFGKLLDILNFYKSGRPTPPVPVTPVVTRPVPEPAPKPVEVVVVKPITDNKEDKDKENNGLGDQKDSDNRVKFDDSSNPGHNKGVAPVSEYQNKIDNTPARAAITTAPVHAPEPAPKPVDVIVVKPITDNKKDEDKEGNVPVPVTPVVTRPVPEPAPKPVDVIVVQPITNNKKEKEKENNGLGDQKDSDNRVKFSDSSNPGHNKTVESGTTVVINQVSSETAKQVGNQENNDNSNKHSEPKKV